jgi:alpha-tubulin suppressor-like RCC1 family protein
LQNTIATADNHSAAVDEGGNLWVWGSNESGQLGVGTPEHTEPILVAGNYVSVHVSGGRTIAIDSDGILWGWGRNDRGQVGGGVTTDFHAPEWLKRNVAAVGLEHSSTFAITNEGSLWAWGANENGQLGDGTSIDRHAPVWITDNGMNEIGAGVFAHDAAGLNVNPTHIEGQQVAAVVSGARETLVLTHDGVLWSGGVGAQGPYEVTEEQQSFIRKMDNVMLPLRNTN